MVSRAFFVISDITGYTEFLTRSGLEEAQSILDHLFRGFLLAFKPPLIISNFQGDAVLAYIPEGSFSHGQTFIDLLEGLYYTFANLVEQMERSAACACDGCDNLPKLDLKICVHFGQFAIQKIRDREELTGPDVIIAHRMLKNSVRNDTGWKSYLLLTEQAVQQLDLQSITPDMYTVRAEYEHLGKVTMNAWDLRGRYEAWRLNQREFVKPDQAAFCLEKEFALSPHIIWEFLTLPDHLGRWMSFDLLKSTDSSSRRLARGTVFRCIRKTDNVDYTISDWRPFEYFTITSISESGIPFEATFSFLRSGAGTVMKVLARPMQSEYAAGTPEHALQLQREFEKSLIRLDHLIQDTSFPEIPGHALC